MVWHRCLQLMNSFNKTHADYARTFPFPQIIVYLCFYSDGDVLSESVDVEGCLPDHVLVQALTVHLQLNKQHQYLLKRQPRSNNTQSKK